MQSGTKSRRHRARTLAAAVVLAAPLVLPSQVHATARTFLTAGGLWQIAANWTGNVAPQTGDDVFITNNDAISRTVTYLDSVSLHSFQINQLGTGTNTLMFSLGEMDSNLELIGTTGKGVYTQTAGLNSLTVNAATLGFLIGQSAGSAGTYSLSAAAVLQVTGSGANLGDVIGSSGAGTFIQTGGNHLLNGNAILTLGNNATGFGTYNLSGGSLNSSTLSTLGEVVGSTGSALFLQSGGTNTLGGFGALVVANNSGSNGTYNINSTATLSVNTNETIGNLGSGTFLQSAGNNTMGGILTLGGGTTGIGFYQLSGTGSLTATNGETIGFNNIGTFSQQGGTNNAQAGMSLGAAPLGTGVYNMIGGSLNVNGTLSQDLNVGLGGTGTFTQSGGTVSVGTGAASINLNVGSGLGAVGVYSMTNTATLNVSGAIEVGNSSTGGVGTFNQTAGTVTCAGMDIGPSSPGSTAAGTYLISSGATLNVGTNSVFINAGGQFIQSGGSLLVGSGIVVLSSTGDTLPQVFLNGGHYRLSGGTLEVDGADGVQSGSFEQLGGLHLLRGLGLYGSLGGDGTSTYFLSGGTFEQTTIPAFNDQFELTNFGSLVFLNNSSLVGTVNGFLNANMHLAGGSVSGVLQNQGTFSYESGSFSAQLMNSGTFNLNGNTLSTASVTINNDLGTFNGPGIVNATFNNSGVTNANGTLTTGTFSNFGLLNVGTNGAVAPSFMINSGQIALTRGALVGSGSMINAGGITGGGTLLLAVTQNGGTIHATMPDSPMVIRGALSITLPSSQLLIDAGCTMNLANGLFNTANITLFGPGATLIGNGSLLNSGVVTGPGRINNLLTNGGTVRVSNGELILAGDGDSNQGNGTFSIGGGGTVTVTNGLTNNIGSILLTGGAFNNGVASLNNVGTIAGRGSISSGTISNGGTIVFSGGTNDFLAPLTNSNRTTLTGNSLTTFYSPVDTTTGTLSVNLGSTAVFLGPVTGLGHIAGAGVKDFEGGASAGPIATLTGTTIVGVDGNLNAASVRDSTLNVVGRAVVLPNGTSTGTSRVNNLIIDGTTDNWSGRLDLTNNDLIVDYSGASPLGTIANQIRSGFANGNWTGPGISSASAALAAGLIHKTALGYAEASTLNITLFSGDSVDNSSVLVRYTWSGDANLDGIVNALDFNALATNFGAPSGKLWSDADFNYDNIINTLDFNALASNFDEPAFASPPLGTVVPEPFLLAFPSIALLVLRRRR